MSEPPKAILVAVHLPRVDDRDFHASLDELERLVSTLGHRVVTRITQQRKHVEIAAVLGEGKLQELAELTGGTGRIATTVPRKKTKVMRRREEEAHEDDDEEDEDVEEKKAKVDLVAVDHDLSPSQARNLERATGARVLDRTGVIIEIFHRHAKSREARLQVEIARLAYTAPRIREAPGGKERQRGRGAGEAALELDRRKIRDRIAELREELDAIQREQGIRRSHRRQARRIALVGYTNAGKSSLMRALTGSDVYVEDKLFATLDTTVRALKPEVKPRILVSDTVGFIKKLPHDLVASFKSTLDEALEASLLLHLVDASDPSWESQLTVTRDVLAEIGAGDVPRVLVFNKIDLLDRASLNALRLDEGDAWFVSALDGDSVKALRQRIIVFFEASFEDAELEIPFDKQSVLAQMHESGRIVKEDWSDRGVRVHFRAERDAIARIRSLLAR